jgi:arylsulfatase A-like enzyme
MTSKPSLPPVLLWGTFQGAAAWSAYAIIEFAVSSIVFGILRPYAMFTPWHWSMTGILVLGFVVAGCAAGAAVSLVLWFGRRSLFDDEHGMHVLDVAGGLTVTLAFLVNLALGFYDAQSYVPLVVACLLLGAVQVLAVLSTRWRGRVGLLTNYWISAVLLLGVGTDIKLREMSVAGQLGAHLDMWSWVLGIALVVIVVVSVVVGRTLAHSIRETRASWRISAATLAAILFLFAASEVLSAFGATPGVQAAPKEIGSSARPNVVVIVMDTVRADHLSVYGYDRDTTPTLKALARDSVVYPNAISSSDITLTSHASLFTGMYASWHGAYCDPDRAPFGQAVNPNYPTLAELLKANGYSTVAVAANMYLRADFGLQRGFEEFHIPRPVAMLPADVPFLLRRAVRRGLRLVVDTTQFDRLFNFAGDIDSELLSALAQRGREPFFAFLNYMDAHFPYVPPAPYEQRFPGQRAGFTQEDLEAEQFAIVGGRDPSPVYLRHCLSKYDGGIAYEDEQVGRVVDWLKQHNAYDNTMIVIASDHGEAFGERHRVGHGNSPYQNVVHVALMIKYPHSAHPGTEATPASLIDVAPTVLATIGLRAPQTMQGRDLNHPEALAGRVLYNEAFPCAVLQAPECPRGCMVRSVYEWPYKYITSSTGKRELFDLSKDPLEEHTLYAQQRAIADRLRTGLETWIKGLPTHTTQKPNLTRDDLKRFKGLGYVQ